MSYVNTVLGPIHSSEMGLTSPHEHILWGVPGFQYDPEWWFHTPKVFAKCLDDLKEFYQLGGRTFVDVSGVGLGRDIELYRMLSRYSGVHIVASAGFWADTGIYSYFRNKDIDYWEQFLVDEVTKGIGNTDAKAGVLKVGNSIFKVTELEILQHRAAARASKRTGAAIVTHGMQWQPWPIAEIFKSEGVDPSRVIASHVDGADCIDLDRDIKLAKMGYWIAYDDWGYLDSWYWGHYAMSDEARADLVKAVVDAGCTNRLLLASGANLFSLGWQRSAPYVGKHTVNDLLRLAPGKLRRIGLNEDFFRRVMVDNPREVIPIQ